MFEIKSTSTFLSRMSIQQHECKLATISVPVSKCVTLYWVTLKRDAKNVYLTLASHIYFVTIKPVLVSTCFWETKPNIKDLLFCHHILIGARAF